MTSQFEITETSDIQELKNEIKDLRIGVNEILELKKEVKEIKEILKSIPKGENNNESFIDAGNEMLELKKDLKEIKETLVSSSTKLEKPNSKVVKEEEINDCEENNGETLENIDDNSTEDTLDCQDTFTNDNDNHENENENENESEIIYDKRIQHLVTGILGDSYMDYTAFLTPPLYSSGQYRRHRNIINLGLLREYYEKLFYLRIERNDICNVIDALYKEPVLNTIILSKLLNKLSNIENNIRKVNDFVSNAQNYLLVSISYYNDYKDIIQSYNNCFATKIKEGINNVLKGMNVIRLRYVYDNIKYLLVEKNVGNVTVYEPKVQELIPVVDRLLVKYRGVLYTYEFDTKNAYSFYFNKNSFCTIQN
ncbi:hypothetical protein PIROE2DRAFT_60272 [Piromyces sp. E2]|nr:hypothetical protein PIROE2DRAFT_60272 [Piromyces sp. E2]|eukprot:OUM65038.1 hypothetical protein PIROE2DRAFT_60272 [Piromyces sp. E2]